VPISHITVTATSRSAEGSNARHRLGHIRATNDRIAADNNGYDGPPSGQLIGRPRPPAAGSRDPPVSLTRRRSSPHLRSCQRLRGLPRLKWPGDEAPHLPGGLTLEGVGGKSLRPVWGVLGHTWGMTEGTAAVNPGHLRTAPRGRSPPRAPSPWTRPGAMPSMACKRSRPQIMAASPMAEATAMLWSAASSGLRSPAVQPRACPGRPDRAGEHGRPR
jgi:hypothetical protein